MKQLKNIKLTQAINVITIFAIFALALTPMVIGAQGAAEDIFGNVTPPNQFVRAGETNVGTLIVQILQVFLSIVGLVAVVFLVWGGFKYMTSSGDEEKVKAAKGTIINALIGLIIVVLAFALVRVIYNLIDRVE